MVPQRIFGNSSPEDLLHQRDSWHFDFVAPNLVRFSCHSLFDSRTCEWDSMSAEFSLAGFEACLRDFELTGEGNLQEGSYYLRLKQYTREVTIQVGCATQAILLGEVCVPPNVMAELHRARGIA